MEIFIEWLGYVGTQAMNFMMWITFCITVLVITLLGVAFSLRKRIMAFITKILTMRKNARDIAEQMTGDGLRCSKPLSLLRTWKTVRVAQTSFEQLKAELQRQQIAEDGRFIENSCPYRYGRDLITAIARQAPEVIEACEIELVRVAVWELGFYHNPTVDELFERARALGLDTITPELSVPLRFAIEGELLYVGTLIPTGLNSGYLVVLCDNGKRSIDSHSIQRTDQLDSTREFLFARRRPTTTITHVESCPTTLVGTCATQGGQRVA